MAITSNLYASKVFSEHPTASWPLDDDIFYLSLIDEEDRSFDTWILTNATYVDLLPYPDNEFPDGPFPFNTFTELTAVSSSAVSQAISSSIFNLQDLNQQMNTFAINMYLFTESSVDYYEYGYRYLDPFTATWIEDTRQVNTYLLGQWTRIGNTFNAPNVDAPVQLIFRVKFFEGDNPSIIMNGLSVGQWSENVNSVDLGLKPQEVNEELQALLGASTLAVPMQAYGVSENDGYFLVEDNRLLAINKGIPMVFGSDNVTRLFPSQSLPSVVMPSMGVLNKSGQYNSYTVEMWLRIENNYPSARRIWGPLNSDYGLYVKNGYLSLVIGNEIGSYFVADWYRPMLVHIIIRENGAALMINGEQVVSISYDAASLTLPEINEDWMGFYCHQDMPIFEIDCVSVLPYIVSESVAKRRFVWGQGVENPETINSAYQGTVAYIDYPFSEYTSNFAYPDRGNWDAAYFENLVTTRQSISVPQYNLPQIIRSDKTLQEFYDDNKILNEEKYPSASATVISASAGLNEILYITEGAHDFELNDRITVTGASIASFNITANIIEVSASNSFILEASASGSPTFINGLAKRNHAKFMSFRPNETWTKPGYYLFENMNVLTDVVRGIWGIFEIESATASAEPLMQFVNGNNVIKIEVDGLNVTYKLYQNGTLYPTSFSFDIVPDQHFVVGFHLPMLFERWGSVIGEFFGNPSAIQIYVGGDGTKTFSGAIYRVGFSNQSNLDKIADQFYSTGDSKGIAIPESIQLLENHLGSYTLMAIEEFNRFYLDIGVSSYWEEYYPLSMFGSYTQDQDGNLFYNLDFLQYNIGYPTTTTIVEDKITGSWTYDQLKSAYSNPIVKTYETLDNFLISGYDNYTELANKIETLVDYDFSQSSVRSYVTFQRISDGANRSLSNYSNYQSISESRVLDVPTYADQFNTKFEIKDQSIIYPPTSRDIKDIGIVLHLDINVKGVRTNPLNIRKMSFASKTVLKNDFDRIGTRFGPKLFPYSKNGIYFNYTQKNPYSIYRDSSPYLYLTKYSGIESLGQRSFDTERGISLPIDGRQAVKQEVSAIQLWMKYTEDAFPQISTTIFSLDALSIDIGFQITSDQSGKRGRITATNIGTGADYTALTFYQDGVQVLTPFIEKDKWTVIGISFDKPINFSNYNGAINLFQSAVFNNISYYKSTALQQAQSIIYRRWDNVDGTPEVPLNWFYWESINPGGLWDNVLKLSESGIYGVSPETLFKSYTGTNRQIVDDNSSLNIMDDGQTVFIGAEWATYTQKPV